MRAARCNAQTLLCKDDIHVPDSDTAEHHGAGNIYAWLQVYLPGAGWTEFDPTNGIVESRDLLRLVRVRDAAQAIPLSGSWIGTASDCTGMEPAIRVTSDKNGP